VHEGVPLRDEIPESATGVAARDTAVHAPRALRAHLLRREVLVDLLPVEHAHRDRPPRRQLPPVLNEPRGFAHASTHPRAAAMIASSASTPRSMASRSASSTRL